MLVGECPYNPKRDVSPVEEFGFIDLEKAFENNTVASNLPDSEANYNGMDDPAMVDRKPRDVFDALRMQDAIDKAASEKESKE